MSNSRANGAFLAVLLGLALMATFVGAAQAKQEKTTLCHKGKLISVAAAAVPAHTAHGDTTETCEDITPPPQPPPPPTTTCPDLVGATVGVTDTDESGNLSVGDKLVVDLTRDFTIGAEWSILASNTDGSEHLLDQNGATLVEQDGKLLATITTQPSETVAINGSNFTVIESSGIGCEDSTNPLIGLIPTLADPNSDGMINSLSFPQLAGAQCTFEADATITVAGVEGTNLAGREFILRNGGTTSFQVFSDFGLVVEGTSGNLSFEENGQTSALNIAGSELEIVSTEGISCQEASSATGTLGEASDGPLTIKDDQSGKTLKVEAKTNKGEKALKAKGGKKGELAGEKKGGE